MYRSIVESCDTYYYMLANDLGPDTIHDFMKPFGFGQLTGIDLEHEQRGILPSTDWKRKYYKRVAAQKWVGGDTISLGIGQGFNAFTPLQMAHAVATLVNDGVVMKPHLVKIIEDGTTRTRTETVPKESYRIPLKQENIDFIKKAMVGVTHEGTGRATFAGAGYESGGKTGTAQVLSIKQGEKYDKRHNGTRLADNAWYTAFAPADKPRIAIAVIVENGGFGAAAAAPIVRKALDFYLLGKRPGDSDKAASPAAAPVSAEDDAAPAQRESQAKAGENTEDAYKPGEETPGNRE
jgi:penicillin-binding protein 2